MADMSSTDTDHDADDATPEPNFESEAAAQAAGRCGATNRHGDPCALPAGWGTPGISEPGDRCRYHGGSSTGPTDTDYLEDNDYAAGNDGGAPEGNTNALKSGAFVPLGRLPGRLPLEDVHRVARWEWWAILMSRDRRPELRSSRRRQLAWRWAWLDVRRSLAAADAWTDGPGGGRGLVLERERTVETDGAHATWIERRLNPSADVEHYATRDRHTIADMLGLHDLEAPPVEAARTRAFPPLPRLGEESRPDHDE
jgi:hypothetical protein